MPDTFVTTPADTGRPRSLAGRVAVVTGSTSGIGLGIARALASAGANVVLNGLGDRTEIEGLRATVARDNGVGVAYDDANMADPAAVAGMVERTVERFAGIDILVNNAGIQHVAPIAEFPVEKWDAIQAINLSAAFHAIRAAVPHMADRGWGRIVNIASAHGLVGSPFKSAYVAAKHGVLGLTKVIALETAQQGITCNAVCPGYVWTPLVEKQIADQAAAHNISREEVVRTVLLAQQARKEFVTVEELGAIALFLCSEGARSITGVALPVDGGWTAH
jgi:3-hydroxybutyrate dehydrogenase